MNVKRLLLGLASLILLLATLVTGFVSVSHSTHAASSDTSQSGYLTPEWWGGGVSSCDPAHHGGSSSIGMWHGIASCYPRPGNDVWVRFTRGGAGVGTVQPEWECVEMVERYMFLAWGISPYGASGAQIVSRFNYYYNNSSIAPGIQQVNVSSGNPNHFVPSVGDVLSFGTWDSAGGHTAIVTDIRPQSGSGNYQFTIFQQNASYAYDSTSITMSNWNMQVKSNSGYPSTINGWLHQQTGNLSGYIAGINPPSRTKQVFGIDRNGQVSTSWQCWGTGCSGGWANPWHEINTGTTKFPLTAHLGVSMNQAGTIEVFATDVNGHFWHMWGQGGSWSGWNSFDGVGSSDITAADYDNNNDMVLWITGTDGSPYYRYSTNGSWGSWIKYANATFPLGTRYTLGRDPFSINVVAIAGDGKMYSNWTPWGTMNWQSAFAVFGDLVNGVGFVAEPKSLIRDSSGDEEIIAPRTDGSVWHNWEVNGGWQGWAQISSSPQVKNQIGASLTQGTVPELFARNVNYWVNHNWNTGCANCYSGWNLFSSNIPFSSDPNSISDANNYPEIFVTATNGNVYHQYLYRDGSGNLHWSGWVNLGSMG